jgi:hypothetical protein
MTKPKPTLNDFYKVQSDAQVMKADLVAINALMDQLTGDDVADAEAMEIVAKLARQYPDEAESR